MIQGRDQDFRLGDKVGQLKKFMSSYIISISKLYLRVIKSYYIFYQFFGNKLYRKIQLRKI